MFVLGVHKRGSGGYMEPHNGPGISEQELHMIYYIYIKKMEINAKCILNAMQSVNS